MVEEIGRILVADAGLATRQRPAALAKTAAAKKRGELEAELVRAARMKAPRPSVPGGVCLRGGRLVNGRPLDPALWGSGCDAAAWPELWPAATQGTEWNPSLWAPPAALLDGEAGQQHQRTRAGATLNRWQAAKKQKKVAERERARGQ